MAGSRPDSRPHAGSPRRTHGRGRATGDRVGTEGPGPAGAPTPVHEPTQAGSSRRPRPRPSCRSQAGGASQQSPRPGAHASPCGGPDTRGETRGRWPQESSSLVPPGGRWGACASGRGCSRARAGWQAQPRTLGTAPQPRGSQPRPGAATRPPPPGRRRPRLFLRALRTLAAAGSSAADLSLGRSSATRVAGARVRREWRREQAPSWPRWEGGLPGRPRARPRERRRAPGTARAGPRPLSFSRGGGCSGRRAMPGAGPATLAPRGAGVAPPRVQPLPEHAARAVSRCVS